MERAGETCESKTLVQPQIGMKTTCLIAGFGEIGQALCNTLSGVHSVEIFDKAVPADIACVDILHICFPYSYEFAADVEELKRRTGAKHTIIHSTVPIGTSASLRATHSPVVGIHPHLERSLRTFTKFLGGPEVSAVADHFRSAGIKVYLCDRSETTELMKLLCTTFYGLCVEFTKETSRLCRGHDVPFEAWSLWTQNYNRGYEQLGYPEYRRPDLVPIMSSIGGHCVLKNCDLIGGPFAELIKEMNLPLSTQPIIFDES